MAQETNGVLVRPGGDAEKSTALGPWRPVVVCKATYPGPFGFAVQLTPASGERPDLTWSGLCPSRTSTDWCRGSTGS